MASTELPPASPPRPGVFSAPNVRGAKPEDWAQLIRFCLVGLSGYVINLAVFKVLFDSLGAHHLVAAIGAFGVAWSSNFVLNKHWTFRRHGLSTLQQGGRNLMVSLVALTVNLALLAVFVDVIGLPEFPSQAAAVAAVMPINFLLNRRWSFR